MDSVAGFSLAILAAVSLNGKEITSTLYFSEVRWYTAFRNKR